MTTHPTAQTLAERAADKAVAQFLILPTEHDEFVKFFQNEAKLLLRCADRLDECIDCLERTCPPKGGWTQQVINRAKRAQQALKRLEGEK